MQRKLEQIGEEKKGFVLVLYFYCKHSSNIEKSSKFLGITDIGICMQHHGCSGQRPTGLFLVHLNHVVLLHLQRLWGLVIVDPTSVKQEPAHGNR